MDQLAQFVISSSKKNESPPSLPLAIVVEFPDYQGQAFMKDYPKYIPVQHSHASTATTEDITKELYIRSH